MKVIRGNDRPYKGEAHDDQYVLSRAEIGAIISGAIWYHTGEKPIGEPWYAEGLGDCPPVEWMLLHYTNLFEGCEEKPSEWSTEWVSEA